MASMVDKVKSGKVVKPTDLSRRIEVIGAGFGRTGTMSMSAALEKLLNGPVFHTGTIIAQDEPATVKTWMNIMKLDAKPEFIHSALKSKLAGYVGVTDTWGSVMTPELLEMYPDAVVICTLRDPDAWWKSFKSIVDNAPPPILFKIIAWPLPTFRHFPTALATLWTRLCKHYNISPPREPDSKEFLQYHTDWLKRVVPPSRLYFFDVKQGWEPLCKILNVPVPDEPFPRVNEAAAMKELANHLLWTAITRWSMIIVAALVAVASVGMFYFK